MGLFLTKNHAINSTLPLKRRDSGGYRPKLLIYRRNQTVLKSVEKDFEWRRPKMHKWLFLFSGRFLFEKTNFSGK